MLMRLFFIQIVVSDRKQLSLMSDEKSLSRIFHRRFATKSLRNEVSMINFNNKKNKQIFSAIIIIILVLAMVVPMVASALLY